MAITLSKHSYGKAAVKLTKVVRRGDTHHVMQLDVAVHLTGDFSASYTTGDNSNVIATDSMKNTVYVVAKENQFASAEDFAVLLANHFEKTYQPVESVRIDIQETRWKRINVKGKPHEHAFIAGGCERHTAAAVKSKNAAATVYGGVTDLLILKTTQSAFKGFVTDRYRTLKDADERIFSTSITAVWEFAGDQIDYTAAHDKIRTAILETFATHMSYAVQQTMYAIGHAVLAAVPDILNLDLILPNKHHIPANLAPFGLTFDNDIYVPTDAPYGDIRAFIKRD